jgi:hypothetical protein
MAITYDIVCDELRVWLWIGQGHNLSAFYTGDTLVMDDLHDFLYYTLGHPLKVLPEFEMEGRYDLEYVNFTKFKESNPQMKWFRPRGGV